MSSLDAVTSAQRRFVNYFFRRKIMLSLSRLLYIHFMFHAESMREMDDPIVPSRKSCQTALYRSGQITYKTVGADNSQELGIRSKMCPLLVERPSTHRSG